MTTEREPEIDDDATVRMPRPIPEIDPDLEDVDPEQTLVYEAGKDGEDDREEDWESTAIKRVAPHVVAVQEAVAEDPAAEARYGWESASLRRLSREMKRNGYG